MNILLIRPKPDCSSIGLQSVMICEPLELMTLATVLRANGHTAVILDMILERRPLKHFINKHRPEIVGITGYISHVGVIKKYAAKIKTLSPGIKVCVGGVHAAVCPEDFDDPNIDYICRAAEDFYRYTGCADFTPGFPDRNLPKRYTNKYYYLFQTRCALIKTSFGCPYNCNFCFCKEITHYFARPVGEVVGELLTIP